MADVALALDELVALDLLTLRAHTEQAGDALDEAPLRLALAKTLAVSESAVVRRDDRLLAYALLQPQPSEAEPDRWFVTGFNTHPAHRSAPVLLALFGQMAALVRRHGIGSLHSHVYKTNRASVAFHRRLGFDVLQENAKAFAFAARVTDLRWPGAAS